MELIAIALVMCWGYSKIKNQLRGDDMSVKDFEERIKNIEKGGKGPEREEKRNTKEELFKVKEKAKTMLAKAVSDDNIEKAAEFLYLWIDIENELNKMTKKETKKAQNTDKTSLGYKIGSSIGNIIGGIRDGISRL